MIVVKLLLASPIVFGMLLQDSGCGDPKNSADATQARQQEVLSERATKATGMPGVVNFTERRMAKKILELRDQSLTTYTYVPDIQGHLWHLCDSIGYGLPYSTQYTNPQYIAAYGANYGYAILPQADPNGLYSPAASEGTWIACVNQKKQDYDVVYVEPRIVVSPFRLNAFGEYQTARPER